jgi:hypothetical protein
LKSRAPLQSSKRAGALRMMFGVASRLLQDARMIALDAFILRVDFRHGADPC